jgi:hypothetical protein
MTWVLRLAVERYDDRESFDSFAVTDLVTVGKETDD